MTWARLDDTFHGHPKILRAGLEATGLHIIAISYCSWALTDGHVSKELVKEKAGRRADALVARLVDAGLWVPNGDGWEIHDYLAFNPSRQEVEAKRAEVSQARADAGRKGAAARWQTHSKADGKRMASE